MNRDDILRMAREAGIYMGGHPMNPLNVYLGDLERFAALVAAQEREACAFDAEWCIQNHLEHLMPERIRARRQV
jgi:hypothetical protein